MWWSGINISCLWCVVWWLWCGCSVVVFILLVMWCGGDEIVVWMCSGIGLSVAMVYLVSGVVWC